MSRVFDMCDICKLDKYKQCDYNCIKRREDRIFRFHTCPKFIYDDEQPIKNGELLSTYLKYDIDAAYNTICYLYELIEKKDILNWLNEEVKCEH